MSTPAFTPTAIQTALFSPAQSAVLALLFGSPEERFQSAELIRRVGKGSGAVQRQIATLVSAGLVTVTRVGNQKHYQADARSPVFSELSALIRKTTGIVPELRDALVTVEDKLAFAFVFGSVAAGTARSTSDVDVMVVRKSGSELDHATLFDLLTAVDRRLGRSVEPVLMSLANWTAKRAKGDSFVARIAAGPKLMIVGEADAVTRT